MGLVRTADVVKRRFARVLEPCGLSNQQYNVLRILRGAAPEALPTMEIAERMVERAPGVTRLLDRLEANGLVSRERGAEDRRCVLCSITDAGLRLLAELDPPIDEADEAVLAMLSESQTKQLIDLLDAIRQAQETT